MVLQSKVTWLIATAMSVVAAALPAAAAADIGSPAPVCLLLPGVPGVTPSCPDGSQTQPQPTSNAQGTKAAPATTKEFSVAAAPDLARTLVAEVNRTRRALGLRPLAFSTRLTNAGTAHAQALAVTGQFTHAWPNSGKLFTSWIRGFYPARGYRTWSAGENLLWASPGFVPANAVQQWLNSPMHRRVLLSPTWRELGIGVVTAAAAPGAYGGRDVQVAAAEFGRRF